MCWAFELADNWGIPDPIKMLEEMNRDLPNQWAAYRRLKDPKYREARRLEILEEESPEQFQKEVQAQQLAELEESRKQSR